MSTITTAVERHRPVLSDVERMTLLGFLAAYRGYTRDAYTLDLRQFTAWCWQHHHELFRQAGGWCHGPNSRSCVRSGTPIANAAISPDLSVAAVV